MQPPRIWVITLLRPYLAPPQQNRDYRFSPEAHGRQIDKSAAVGFVANDLNGIVNSRQMGRQKNCIKKGGFSLSHSRQGQNFSGSRTNLQVTPFFQTSPERLHQTGFFLAPPCL